MVNFLKKVEKYVEGRLSTRSYQDKDGQTRYVTEVVISDMILLDSKREGGESEEFNVPDEIDINQDNAEKPAKSKKAEVTQEVQDDDIPF